MLSATILLLIQDYKSALLIQQAWIRKCEIHGYIWEFAMHSLCIFKTVIGMHLLTCTLMRAWPVMTFMIAPTDVLCG